MKKSWRKQFRTITGAFVILIVFYLITLGYINIHNHSVQSGTRAHDDIIQITEYTAEKIEDSDSPAGEYYAYTFTVPEIREGGEYFCFYLVHDYGRVYVDDQMIFEIGPAEDNTVGKSIGNNWPMVPLERADSSKTMRVEIIPAYQGVMSDENYFYIGDAEDIHYQIVHNDLFMIVMGFLLITTGLSYILLSISSLVQGGIRGSIGWLGLTAVLFGIFIVTNMVSAPLVFNGHTSFITTVSLFVMTLMPVSGVMYYLSILVEGRTALKFTAWITLIYAALIPVLHITGIAEVRQMNTITHIISLFTICTIAVSVLQDTRKLRGTKKMMRISGTFLLGGAILYDVSHYYIIGNTTTFYATFIAVMVYIIENGYMFAREISLRSSYDQATGMNNKNKCLQIIREWSEGERHCGAIMLDLNDLKNVNDTLGHEAGDEMIRTFAEIVKYCTPERAFAGRYGGDEFIILLRDTEPLRIQQIIYQIRRRCHERNVSGASLYQISFSAGWAWNEKEDVSDMKKLLSEADDRMYEEKKIWHQDRA